MGQIVCCAYGSMNDPYSRRVLGGWVAGSERCRPSVRQELYALETDGFNEIGGARCVWHSVFSSWQDLVCV
ncbi:hypothetical protein VTH06DRAFT_2964 [Thermothelomyces fergusii]